MGRRYFNAPVLSGVECGTAARCASCHKDTHAAWSESLHRNACREPFYKESVELPERTRGSKYAQHCEACHAPVTVEDEGSPD